MEFKAEILNTPFQSEAIIFNTKEDASYKRFRTQALQFIKNHYTVVDHQFDPLIPYMAMTFIDRLHLIKEFEIPTVVDGVDNTDLFLTCCLIISWKLRTETFLLNDFMIQHKLHFSVSDVLDMELRICKKLDWRLATVMPFQFVKFFSAFFDFPPIASLDLDPVYQLIVDAQQDIAFNKFRPSVIAASAMLIVAEEVNPNRFEEFKSWVNSSNFCEPVQILQCSTKLEKLYKSPSTASRDCVPADRGGASSFAAHEDWIHREGKHTAFDDEDPTLGEGKHPALDVEEEPKHGEGNHPASDDEEPTHGEGKHPSLDDKEPTLSEGKQPSPDEEEPTHSEGNHPAHDEEEPTHGEGNHPAADVEEPTHQEGKDPASTSDTGVHFVDEVEEAAAGEIQIFIVYRLMKTC